MEVLVEQLVLVIMVEKINVDDKANQRGVLHRMSVICDKHLRHFLAKVCQIDFLTR